MRKYAYSWAIRIILGFITFIFMFWGLSTGFFQQVHPVGTINGDKILSDDVDREADRLRRTLQNVYGPAAAQVLKGINLRQEAFDRIVENHLVRAEARRLGIEISDEDQQKAISEDRAFRSSDGRFDVRTYQEVLRTNNYLPAQYEEQQRAGMAADLLQKMIGETVRVSDDEARRLYDQRHQRLALAYLELGYQQFTAQIDPTEQQIAAYYQSSREQFREPERIKVVFVRYDPLVLAARTTPSDKEIGEYYDHNLKKLFTHPDQVHARHILIGVIDGASDPEKAAAKAKAEGILGQLKKGADFAKLARDHSADSGNKFKGGDLGSFGRGTMVKPFEEAAFRLKPGQMEVVETSFGYHVIKVEESRAAHAETLAEARPQIIEALRKKAGAELARNAMREDLGAALNGAALKEIAGKRGLQAIETPMFSQNDEVAGVTRSGDFVRAAFKLEAGQTRTIASPGADPYLVKLVQRQAAYIPPLKEIHDRVRAALVKSKAEEAAHDAAGKLLEKIRGPLEFDQVAAAGKLEIHRTGEFDRASRGVPTIGDFPEVTDAAGALPNLPAVIDQVMGHGGNSYIFEVLSRAAPDEKEWKAAEPSFKEELLHARRGQAWTAFLERLRRGARITIDPAQFGENAPQPSM